MNKEEMDAHIEQSKPMRATRAAIKSIDFVLDQVKKRGRGLGYMKKTEISLMRQEWISEVVRNIMEEFRDA